MYIISHPLRGNYGGMLQAYALKEVVLRQNKQVSYVNLDLNSKAQTSIIRKLMHYTKVALHITKIRLSPAFAFNQNLRKFFNIFNFHKIIIQIPISII